jgi:hypothetical protein
MSGYVTRLNPAAIADTHRFAGQRKLESLL